MKKQLKALYSVLPMKRPVFEVLRAFRLPEPIYRHLHFRGEVRIPVGKEGFRIVHYGNADENELFWGGLDRNREHVSLRLWRQLSETADVIVDVGANSGIFSLLAKTVNPRARVLGFEPVPSIHVKFRENCEINRYDILASSEALGDFDGPSEMYVPDFDHSYAASLVADYLSPKDLNDWLKVPIRVRTLSSVFAEQGLAKVDLIKIDVEGFEPQVLTGMGKHLAQSRPSLIVESLSEKSGLAVEKHFEGLGYRYYDIDEISPPRRVPHIGKSSKYNYLVVQPDVAERLGLD
jgi:FkbM family methyltransferase